MVKDKASDIRTVDDLRAYITAKTGYAPEWPKCIGVRAIVIGEDGSVWGTAEVQVCLSTREKMAEMAVGDVTRSMTDSSTYPMGTASSTTVFVVFNDGQVVRVEVIAEMRVHYTAFAMCSTRFKVVD